MINRELVRVTERGKGGIWVEGVQQSACNSCSAKSGCGQHSLSKLGRPVRLWVDTPEQFEIGEIVELTLPQGSLAASAAALYGLPLLGLIAGAVAGHQLWTNIKKKNKEIKVQRPQAKNICYSTK